METRWRYSIIKMGGRFLLRSDFELDFAALPNESLGDDRNDKMLDSAPESQVAPGKEGPFQKLPGCFVRIFRLPTWQKAGGICIYLGG